jgi:hypothetical protein
MQQGRLRLLERIADAASADPGTGSENRTVSAFRASEPELWVGFLEHRGVKCNGGLSVGVHCGSGSGIWSGRERADAPEGCSGLTVIAVFGVHCL